MTPWVEYIKTISTEHCIRTVHCLLQHRRLRVSLDGFEFCLDFLAIRVRFCLLKWGKVLLADLTFPPFSRWGNRKCTEFAKALWITVLKSSTIDSLFIGVSAIDSTNINSTDIDSTEIKAFGNLHGPLSKSTDLNKVRHRKLGIRKDGARNDRQSKTFGNRRVRFLNSTDIDNSSVFDYCSVLVYTVREAEGSCLVVVLPQLGSSSGY